MNVSLTVLTPPKFTRIAPAQTFMFGGFYFFKKTIQKFLPPKDKMLGAFNHSKVRETNADNESYFIP